MRGMMTEDQWDGLSAAQQRKMQAACDHELGMLTEVGLEGYCLYPTMADLLTALMAEEMEVKVMALRAINHLFAPKVQVHLITNKPVGVTCDAEVVEPVDLLYRIYKERC